MGAKLTLTGVRSGNVRKTAQYYTFELITGGSPTAPKGLPVASARVEYTVFVSLKAGNKVGLATAPADQKWLIQGELVLDVSVSDCPGEIGVVAFQLQPLPEVEKNPSEESSTSTPFDSVQAIKEVAATELNPSVDVQMVALDSVHLPEKFAGSRLNPEKTESVRRWMRENGQLDKPLDVCVTDGEMWLEDGYRRYVLAQELGFTEVPVRVVDRK